MPTYGPWNEGRIHEEIIHAKIDVNVNPNPVHELLGENPTRPSGWRVNWRGFAIAASSSWFHDGGLDDPPDAETARSLEAFGTAMSTPVTDAGSAFQYEMYSFGGRNPVSVGVWTAHHGWTFMGMEYRLGYTPAEEGVQARYAVPAGMDPSTSEYTTQLEPWALGETARIQLLSLEVIGPGTIGDYGLFCKPMGAGTEFLHHGPASINESKSFTAPYEWDQAAAQTIMHLVEDDPDHILPGVAANTDHPDMPRLSWLYDGDDLADAHFNPSTLVSAVDGMAVDIKVRYQFPRWRQVFFSEEVGRYKVNAGSEDSPVWKYLIPRVGENEGFGVGKVNVGTEAAPIWQRLNRALKVSDNGNFLMEPPS